MPAKYNLEESLKEISKYSTYLVTGHGAINPSIDDLFVCVPNNIILVLVNNNFDSFTLSDRSERKFVDNIEKYGDEYLQKSLLIENGDLPNTHILKNKCIYMPGSCVINFDIDLKTEPKMANGIFKASQIKNNILKNRGKNKKIIYLTVCTSMWFGKIFNHSFIEKLKIDPNTIDENIICYEFVTALTECTRNCYLYSLEKFTSTFTTYESYEIEDLEFIEETSFDSDAIVRQKHDLFNIISNKQIMLYVDKYFSKPASIKSRIFNWLFGPPIIDVKVSPGSLSTSSPSLVYDKSDSDVEKYIMKYESPTDTSVQYKVKLYKNIMSKLNKQKFNDEYIYPQIKKYICKKANRCIDIYIWRKIAGMKLSSSSSNIKPPSRKKRKV
jgi:hypothetical protein